MIPCDGEFIQVYYHRVAGEEVNAWLCSGVFDESVFRSPQSGPRKSANTNSKINGKSGHS